MSENERQGRDKTSAAGQQRPGPARLPWGVVRSSRRPSLADKLKALMTVGRDLKGRPFSARALAAATKELPDGYAHVSRQNVNYIYTGEKDNPTANTIVALCAALGGIPPAHLLPHEAYDDLQALQAFEDPRARHVLALLAGLPDSEMDELTARLERRRAELGLETVQPFQGVIENTPPPQDKPDDPPKRGRGRRRSKEEIAQYGADSLEGF